MKPSTGLWAWAGAEAGGWALYSVSYHFLQTIATFLYIYIYNDSNLGTGCETVELNYHMTSFLNVKGEASHDLVLESAMSGCHVINSSWLMGLL